MSRKLRIGVKNPIDPRVNSGIQALRPIARLLGRPQTRLAGTRYLTELSSPLSPPPGDEHTGVWSRRESGLAIEIGTLGALPPEKARVSPP
jgi:hypothetical protein